MIRYSQNNEQDLILQYFGDRVGTWLDLGANDGITLSNTRALAERGWSGVCVDASPTAFAKLESLYAGHPHIETHHVAMADKVGWLTLHESGPHITANDTALLSSVIETETTKWRPTTEFHTVTVPAIDFNELLRRSKYKTFDLISLDIEGMDLTLLRQMDLTSLGASMVVVEVNEYDPAPFVEHCAKHGLILLTRNAENLMFIR